MNGENGKLFVKMDVDMSDFDSSIDKMNEKLKELKRAFASAETNFDSARRNISGATAASVIGKALSGVSLEGEKSSDISFDSFNEPLNLSQINKYTGFSDSQNAKFTVKTQDTEAIIKREVENEFARQASKLARI